RSDSYVPTTTAKVAESPVWAAATTALRSVDERTTEVSIDDGPIDPTPPTGACRSRPPPATSTRASAPARTPAPRIARHDGSGARKGRERCGVVCRIAEWAATRVRPLEIAEASVANDRSTSSAN